MSTPAQAEQRLKAAACVMGAVGFASAQNAIIKFMAGKFPSAAVWTGLLCVLLAGLYMTLRDAGYKTG
jgi:hypothetical protein